MSKYYLCSDGIFPIMKLENEHHLFWDYECQEWIRIYYINDEGDYTSGIDPGIEIPEHLALLWIAYE